MSKPISLAALTGLITAALLNSAAAQSDTLSFEKLDTDNDGLLTPSEAQGAPILDKRWSRLDEDDSGTLDRREFSAIKQMPQPSTEKADFDTLDENNNGYITAVEAREAPWLQEMWSQIDDDNSGAIDRDEYATFEGKTDTSRGVLKQQRFDELDEDKDGVISMGEVRQHPELRQIWPEVDADNSGAVDTREFTRWAGAQEGTELLAEAPPFERLDEDNNGYITAVEGRELAPLHRNWSQFDTDNSGAIDRAEFSAFEQKLQQGETMSGDMQQDSQQQTDQGMKEEEAR